MSHEHDMQTHPKYPSLKFLSRTEHGITVMTDGSFAPDDCQDLANRNGLFVTLLWQDREFRESFCPAIEKLASVKVVEPLSLL